MSDPAINYLRGIESDLARIEFNRCARAERPTQPPEPRPRDVADDERLRAQAQNQVEQDMRCRDAWFEVMESEALDVPALITALHEVHVGNESAALDALRTCARETVAALARQEHEELRKDTDEPPNADMDDPRVDR